jgi:hypothetical protein
VEHRAVFARAEDAPVKVVLRRDAERFPEGERW